ncbi:F-box domain-containing protein [Mycena chlorophos]|uniref:F-box domain-containing protein n=1 Tax=Mycena chlorophos TaxID=658473 RepID=A0A8H6TIT9_MYCCL|nr:F-box domain-containing protein [Mycena chlorophos]
MSPDVPSAATYFSLDHFLSTNIAPTEAEHIFLRNLLEERQNRAEELKSRAETLRSELALVTREEENVNADICKATTALSPIRRLPPEILCEIFTRAAKHHREEYPTDLAPWYLGQICSHWRTVALSFSVLWAKIRVHEDDKLLTASPELFQARIFSHLARSGSALLSVYFFFYHDIPMAAQSVIALLVGRSTQWRKVSMSPLRQTNMFFYLLQPVKGRLPHLEQFSCEFYTRLSDNVDVDMFFDAPSLSKLSLSIHHDQLRFPWAIIQHCSLEGSLDLSSLAEARLLVSLHLNTDCNEDDDELEPNQPFVQLPSLRRLRVAHTTALRFLIAPNLERLSTCTRHLHHLASFLQRSACPLSFLGLQEDNAGLIEISGLVQALGYVPSLDLLAIFPRWRDSNGRRFANDEPRIHDVRPLFVALESSNHDGSAALVPRLSTFIFGLEQNPFANDEFLGMIYYRSRPIHSHRLARIVVEESCKDSEHLGDDHEARAGLEAGAGFNIEWMNHRALMEARETYFPRT